MGKYFYIHCRYKCNWSVFRCNLNLCSRVNNLDNIHNNYIDWFTIWPLKWTYKLQRKSSIWQPNFGHICQTLDGSKITCWWFRSWGAPSVSHPPKRLSPNEEVFLWVGPSKHHGLTWIPKQYHLVMKCFCTWVESPGLCIENKQRSFLL